MTNYAEKKEKNEKKSEDQSIQRLIYSYPMLAMN